ncbi:alpha/beta hydrolase [Luteibacter sp. PPL201]|uniref:Alpha/beta hydrolase n=1 Tax=Luteibacter sahnii TaxID=3021977 RepID=A0ABT6BCA6_9GAMM
MDAPTVFFLHALGMSGREWRHVVAGFPSAWRCVPLDLPGFGDNADLGHAPLEGLVAWTSAQIKSLQPSSWVVVGHSMGGKVASLVAARAAAGEAGLAGCMGVALVAASPPSPEPMDESRRATMIGWFANGAIGTDDADAFLDANTAQALGDNDHDVALSDLQRTHPAAWIGWLEEGSREDRTDDVGSLPFPAVIIAGADDGDLGEPAQGRLNAPHYPKNAIRVIRHAAHLMPLEQPVALTDVLVRHLRSMFDKRLPCAFVELLNSPRVTTDERARLVARHHAVAPSTPMLERAARDTLHAVVSQVLGGHGDARDIACRVEATLSGHGDGWRFVELPPDRDAWQNALATLDRWAGGFAGLSAERQATWLKGLAESDALDRHEEGSDDLSLPQMRRWFEDARTEIVRTWLSLPSTWARIGYDGFALGGDRTPLAGYVETAADTLEPWQRDMQACR